jgi:gliotoxin/aspirochlorine biosynthesis thioredoxin reductase
MLLKFISVAAALFGAVGASPTAPPNDTGIPIADALIIGGGPGGLATALALARQRYSSAVFDSGIYRNRNTVYMHNVLGLDHTEPRVFRNQTRAVLTNYYSGLVTFHDVEIVKLVRLEQLEPVFVATDPDGGEYAGHTVILAQGVKEAFPDIPGYEDCFGRAM